MDSKPVVPTEKKLDIRSVSPTADELVAIAVVKLGHEMEQ